MQHTIPVERLGAAGKIMADAIGACVHCGFCLAACPTYRLLGEEMDSPRGRITLMKSALEGSVPVAETLPYIDRCLGCEACVPACPSGVRYDALLPLYRQHAEPSRQRSLSAGLARALTHETLPHPDRFRMAAAPRRLLAAVPGLELVEIPEGEMCCGSAGTYNLEQPTLAAALGERKARHILETGAQALAAGNIGCLVQVATHLKRLGHTLPLWHTFEVLARAYRREPVN